MAYPSTSLPRDGQIINYTAMGKIPALQDRSPSDGTKAHQMQPQHLTFEKPESSEEFERCKIANREIGLSNLRETLPWVFGWAIMKIRSPLFLTIEFAFQLDKFSQPMFKYFRGDSYLGYHIMHYINVMAL